MEDSVALLSPEEAEKKSVEQMAKALEANLSAGLSKSKAEERRIQFGKNELEVRKENPFLIFLSFFWGPIPWTIETAAVLSCIIKHWVDFFIILTLLLFNAVIGFIQRYKARSVIEELQKKLALQAFVLREGKWGAIPAMELVPGDIIRLQAGNVVPADVKLCAGEYLSVDQSALTGESLLSDKKRGGLAYSGTLVKKGEMQGLVYATGGRTFFGKTASLVSHAHKVSHFNQAIFQIGKSLILISILLAVLLVTVMLLQGTSFLALVQFALILVVASIPAAMPAVLTVIMSSGAVDLAREQAVVSHLESIEEMAGMDVLCSDKTGTLTKNELSFSEPYFLEASGEKELLTAAAAASEEETEDPIDRLIYRSVESRDVLDELKKSPWRFVPFDPVSKRSESEFQTENGLLRFVKGAPQVVMEWCAPKEEDKIKLVAQVEDYAGRGLRTLGIGKEENGKR
ncbi:MAG: HAD-IC family P-type ATPase, partial [Cytophagales bacterium]|nr:HAD-IC family P-type ATPase [Cytophagales bacterium]